ncbi:hypothetical protein PO909_026847 [Leuciscus waleckii]
MPFDYFARPQSKDLDFFFKYHPIQTSERAIPDVFHSKDGTNRKWLTYNESNHSLFCSVCLAFAKPEHVSDCIEKKKKQLRTKGRGSMVTLMSKTTVNKVVELIRNMIQQTIAVEVRKAGMFSIQIDTTQDLTSKDQCAVVLRYVTDVVHEKLIAVIDCESSTGQYFVELVKQTLEKMDIDIKKCIGNATDGAANMQGQYKGFSALLTGASPNQVHIWCYSHVLNLVLADTTGVVVAKKIEKDVTMKPVIRNKAQGYKAALLKYETILTAEIFLRIFEQTTPLSKYLQTSGMDIASAQHLVTGTEESLRKCARDFQGVMRAADDFVEWANSILEKLEDSEAEVQTSLPEKRIRKHKRQPGELAQDEPIANADTDYKINIHNVILDTVIESFHSRYAENAVLPDNVSCMDPRNFPEIREKGLPGTAMKELSKCLLQFDERASLETLQDELISLAQHWERLKQSLMENYNIRGAASNDEAGEGSEVPDESVEFVSRSCSTCKNCPICCYLLLSQYNLLTDAYHIIGLGNKFLLTLSITQVACERTFSTLKLVKSRLRTSMSQDNLEAFLLMATEKEILMELDKDDIIDKMAESSELLRRLLVY